MMDADFEQKPAWREGTVFPSSPWRVIAACLLSLAQAPLWADDGSQGPVLLVTENNPPYSYSDGKSIVGSSTAIVRRILDHSGLSYTLRMYPWTRAYALATQRDNVLIFSMGRTPQRESLFYWIAVLGRGDFYLMGRAGEQYPATLTQLAAGPYRAVCVRKGAYCTWLSELGFPPDRLRALPDNPASSKIHMVLSGRADVYIADRANIKSRLEQIGVSPERITPLFPVGKTMEYYLAAGKQLRPEILRRVRLGYAKTRRHKPPARAPQPADGAEHAQAVHSTDNIR